MYYLYRENRGTDEMHGYSVSCIMHDYGAADLHLCFGICKM